MQFETFNVGMRVNEEKICETYTTRLKQRQIRVGGSSISLCVSDKIVVIREETSCLGGQLHSQGIQYSHLFTRFTYLEYDEYL